MTQLSVNLNKIALLRNSRGEDLPDLLFAARTILDTGAAGITVHPRPDARHIRSQDVRELRKLLTHYPGRELNIEGNPFHIPHPEIQYPGFLELVEETRPEQVTLVPDNPHQLTSDHGWNLTYDHLRLTPLIERLKQTSPSLRVSLFVNPDATLDNFKIAKEIGADRVELYTDEYAKSYGEGRKEGVLPYREAGKRALQAGLEVNAGHALSLDNLGFLIDHLPWIKEVSIGHALISEALYQGLVPVVKKYLSILSQARSSDSPLSD